MAEVYCLMEVLDNFKPILLNTISFFIFQCKFKFIFSLHVDMGWLFVTTIHTEKRD